MMIDRMRALFLANLGTKIISVAIAIVLWIVVLGSRNVEVTKEIPLEVITANDVIPSNEVPDKIAFRLVGPKAFLRAILDRRDEPIRVNLTGEKPGLVTRRFFSDNIQVPIGVKVLSINPTAILIKLEALKHRDVPVRAEVRGSPPEGYKVGHITMRPPVVRIKGAETRVDGITEISTAPVDISSLKQTFEREVPLDLARHAIQLDGPVPKMTVEIIPTSANYRIKNIDIRLLTSYKVRSEEKSVTVLVRADAKDIKILDRNHVYAVVDLKDKPPGTYNEPVHVSLPEDVGLVKVIPEKVKVTLTK